MVNTTTTTALYIIVTFSVFTGDGSGERRELEDVRYTHNEQITTGEFHDMRSSRGGGGGKVSDEGRERRAT